MSAKFEVVSKYKDSGIELPQRQTSGAAGYDLAAAEDVIIPSIKDLFSQFSVNTPKTLEEMTQFTKYTKIKPTLVSTGLKCKLDDGTYLELSCRSSLPLKSWLILANGVGRK